MELLLKRKWLTEKATIGELYINGVFECFICEDRYRPPPEAKIRGETCIPVGRYEIKITWSPRFNQELPLLLDVPQFQGIRIHMGNRPADTEGCLLPGLVRDVESVKESRRAFFALFSKLKKVAPERTFITIEVTPPEEQK